MGESARNSTRCVVVTGPVTLTSGSLRDFMYVKAAADRPIRVKRIEVSARAAARVQILLCSASTGGTAGTVNALNGAIEYTAGATVGYGDDTPTLTSARVINDQSVGADIPLLWEEADENFILAPGQAIGIRMNLDAGATASAAITIDDYSG